MSFPAPSWATNDKKIDEHERQRMLDQILTDLLARAAQAVLILMDRFRPDDWQPGPIPG